MKRLHITALTGNGMTTEYRTLEKPHMGSEPWVPETVQAAARVLLEEPLAAVRPGIAAMLGSQPVPEVKSYADLDAIVHRWLRALAQEDGE